MKKNLLWLSATFVLMLAFTSCQKENVQQNKNENGLMVRGNISANSSNGLSSTAPVTCGTTTTVNLIDNYPNQFYLTYGNISVSNDANNVYISLASLSAYNFAFTTIKLSIGDVAHLQTVVPFYDYLTGPPSADYTQNFVTPVTSYTFVIPRTSIKTSCFNIFIWAVETTPTKNDTKYVWAQSSTQITGNADSEYINYCLQACSTGKKGGDGDDHDKDKDHDDKDKGHGDKDKDKDHGDKDNDKDHHGND